MIPVVTTPQFAPTNAAAATLPAQVMSPFIRATGPSKPTLESQKSAEDKKKQRPAEEREGEVSRLALDNVLGRPTLKFDRDTGEVTVDAVDAAVGEIRGVPVDVFAEQATRAGLRIARGALLDRYV